MKKIYLITFLIATGFFTKLTANTNFAHGEIISYEALSVTGTVTVNIKCYFKNTVRFIHNPVITLPAGWNYRIIDNKTNQIFNGKKHQKILQHI